MPDPRRSSWVLLSALLDAPCPRMTERSLFHTWLDSWTGIGHVAVGTHRQGYDLQLTQYDDPDGGPLSTPRRCSSAGSGCRTPGRTSRNAGQSAPSTG